MSRPGGDQAKARESPARRWKHPRMRPAYWTASRRLLKLRYIAGHASKSPKGCHGRCPSCRKQDPSAVRQVSARTRARPRRDPPPERLAHCRHDKPRPRLRASAGRFRRCARQARERGTLVHGLPHVAGLRRHDRAYRRQGVLADCPSGSWSMRYPDNRRRGSPKSRQGQRSLQGSRMWVGHETDFRPQSRPDVLRRQGRPR